jgi:hypothetical protein
MVVRVSLNTRIRDAATGSVRMAKPMRIFPIIERNPMVAICSVTLRVV